MPRVLLVDDHDDIRFLLRLALEERDAGFEVVGEAADGAEAIDKARLLRPDVIILDQEMPVLTGTEALPRLRELVPDAIIVLFTANADAEVRQAASAAGVQVAVKRDDAVGNLVDDLSALVMEVADHQRSSAVRLRVGPVDAAVARAWIDSTDRLLAALRAHPDELPDGVTLAVIDELQEFLDRWSAVAEAASEFRWSAAAEPETVERLVGAWATIDQLSDDAMERLGCQWSGPDARPFFDELARAVVTALASGEMGGLEAQLPDGWRDPG